MKCNINISTMHCIYNGFIQTRKNTPLDNLRIYKILKSSLCFIFFVVLYGENLSRDFMTKIISYYNVVLLCDQSNN